MTTLESLAREILVCTKCPLHQSRMHAVPGEGNPHAEVMFIGEGPGQKEDALGRPFVGAAGKFLDEMLRHIGWSRNDVFIANIVKCRPPDNRDPELNEIETCTSHYLYAQIDAIDPILVVPLGRHSMHLFLPDDFKISQVHGRVFRRRNRHYLPLYHPAVALYTASMKETLLSDFRKLPAAIKAIAKK